MIPLYPFAFHPLLKARIWGGQRFQKVPDKSSPPRTPIGESWEITDRPEGVSVIANGRLAGKDLRWLMEHRQTDLLGAARSSEGKFPLLVKIIDAAEKLSLQVHPPPDVAQLLGGEPKTEMWYVAEAAPGAEIYVGLKSGITRVEFEARLRDGTVAEAFHKIAVRPGDAMYLPSGRVHAIGGGIVIFEAQQNSDTTYRVFDWNRVDAEGHPRDLHVAQSLQSIDFQDFEPGLIPSRFSGTTLRRRLLVADPLFEVEEIDMATAMEFNLPLEKPWIASVLSGSILLTAAGVELNREAGEFALVPASAREVKVTALRSARLLASTPG